jgi:uncharacterized membrane protein
MNKNFRNFLIVLAVLFFLDLFYLMIIKSTFKYQVHIVQGVPLSVNYIAFILVYLLMALLFYMLFIDSCNMSILVKDRYLYMFLVGILIYGVYELTNKALFSRWSWKIVFMDTIWGGLLFMLTFMISTKIIIAIEQS